MLLAGIHPKIVSEALGHSSVAFTPNLYSHVAPSIQKAAAKRLDEVLEPELMENVGNRSRRVVGSEEILTFLKLKTGRSGRTRTPDRRFWRPLL